MSHNKEWIGPLYGAELLQTLPVGGGLQQAFPNRRDLEWLREYSLRTVAAFEVLTSHYREAMKENERYRQAIQKLNSDIADKASSEESQ